MGAGDPGYRYMTQRLVLPQAQLLCTTVQLRHVQYSHQIHLRWFTSSAKRATIHRRISVRDTPSNVSALSRTRQWAVRPRFRRARSQWCESIRAGDLGAPPARSFAG